MARAKLNHIPEFQQLRDVLRDPIVRHSFRRVKGEGVAGVFLNGKWAMIRPTTEQLVVADVVKTGDVIGRGEEGEIFVLVSLSQRSFAWLCEAGERFADMEDDNEDRGIEEEPCGSPNGPGNEEDAEEDDALEANGDEADYSSCPNLADQAIVDHARGRQPRARRAAA